MASLITCRVHPVVWLSMVDAHERRGSAETKVIGTLLGTFEKGIVEVTNCYSVPHSEKADSPMIRIQYNREMYDLYKKANSVEIPVGWFSTHPEVRENSTQYHEYYQQFVSTATQTREHMPIVLLTFDTTLQDHRMGIRAYIRMHAGIPKAEKEQCTIFMPVEVEIASYDTEQVGVDCLFAGTKNPKRIVDLFSGIGQIQQVTDQIIEWIEKIKTYVDDVLEGRRAPDVAVGRKLMRCTSNVSQMEPEKFTKLLTESMKDYLMVVYLAQLTKNQLSLHDCLVGL
jgi:translation initiation factor 3 subunit F